MKAVQCPAVLALTLALGVAGCVSAPPVPPHVAPIAAPSSFTASAARDGAADALDHWWTAWNDPDLDMLVEKALRANPDIRTAQAHVAAARALITISESALYPTVAAHGAVWGSESNSEADGRVGSFLEPNVVGNSGNGQLVGLGAAWEPDLFGGRHADIAVSQAIAESATHGAEGVQLTVVSDVVENYQELQGLRRRLLILDRSIGTASHLAAYLDARLGSGQASAADVTQARNGLEALKALRPPLVSLIDARRRRLAVLAGDLPESEVVLADAALINVPDAPKGQLPSAVLDRRPDVRARGSIVEAHAARLKSLKTDLKPRFGIEFLGQGGHVELSGLPGFGGVGGLVGLTASVPIFTGGRLRARVSAGDAELEAAFAAYDKSVLTALEEVESAYGFREGLDLRLDGLRRAQQLSGQRADQLDALYKAGRKPLSDVLQARLVALEDEDRSEQAAIARGTATVQLYRALGGGWERQTRSAETAR